MLDGTEFFECTCGADEHTIRFTLSFDDEDGEDSCIYTSVFLSEGTFWNRVLKAIRYIFGYKCRYGHWGNWEMCPEDVYRLRSMCDTFIQKTQEKK